MTILVDCVRCRNGIERYGFLKLRCRICTRCGGSGQVAIPRLTDRRIYLIEDEEGTRVREGE